jgi:hypothetical protein
MKSKIENLPSRHPNPYIDGFLKQHRRAPQGAIKTKLKAPFKVHEPAKLGSSPARAYVKNFQSIRTNSAENVGDRAY